MMASEYFVAFKRTAFVVNCSRSGIKHSSSKRLVQAVKVFGCSLRFPRKDFIALFRIVFPMKCHLIEDIEMYFWLETKMQGKQPLGNSLQSYLVLGYRTNLRRNSCPPQSFSLVRWTVNDDLYRTPPVMFSSGF